MGLIVNQVQSILFSEIFGERLCWSETAYIPGEKWQLQYLSSLHRYPLAGQNIPILHTQRGKYLDTGEALGKKGKEHGWKVNS